ncbi:MAG: acetolactate synthase small subunit [Clostridia bacterium]|nr:acetolactate synthase small subunit [Clostridia bacterium]MBQ5563062.1 acetolactate synthase small subunit [Clostridia bacterium]
MENKHIIGLLVHNHPGVLLRVTSLISRRGFNIDSLTVSPAGIEGFSRMTIRINDDSQVEQFINQMMKIVDVKKAEVLPETESVASELVLVKVSSNETNKNDIIAVTSLYHASVVNIGENSLTFRASGTPSQLDMLIRELSVYGILEMARTGIAALETGDKCLYEG